MAVGAAAQVFFSMPFAIWNGALGLTKIVVSFISGHTGIVERRNAQDTLQHGLYMCMVAVADLVIAAAICTIVVPVGYMIYMYLHSNPSMQEQKSALIGDFVKPISKDEGMAESPYLQQIAYRGMKILMP